MNNELKMAVNAIVEEISRTEERINKRLDKMDQRFDKMELQLESMQHDINACKLETSTVEVGKKDRGAGEKNSIDSRSI